MTSSLYFAKLLEFLLNCSLTGGNKLENQAKIDWLVSKIIFHLYHGPECEFKPFYREDAFQLNWSLSQRLARSCLTTIVILYSLFYLPVFLALVFISWFVITLNFSPFNVVFITRISYGLSPNNELDVFHFLEHAPNNLPDASVSDLEDLALAFSRGQRTWVINSLNRLKKYPEMQSWDFITWLSKFVDG